MKYVEPRPFAAAQAGRTGQSVKPTQDGSIFIELINAPFLYQLKGTPAEYRAGLERPIAKGWLCCTRAAPK